MARSKRDGEDKLQELNLTPIMNMVVILIPLLLLSIVFLEVSVINITAPKLSVGPSQPVEQEDPTEKLNLTVAVGAKGFEIGATGAILPQKPGCPVPGPTICLSKQNVDVTAKFTRARELFNAGNMVEGEGVLKEALDAYNWVELYNTLARIKTEYKDETVMKISADPDIPYAAIVRVMDVARFRLEKDTYSKSSEFWTASYKKSGTGQEELFPDPVLAVAQ